MARAQKDSTEQIKEQVKEVAEDAKGSLNQLLGIRGASESTNIWKIRLQLTKPVTWVPLIWGAPTLPWLRASAGDECLAFQCVKLHLSLLFIGFIGSGSRSLSHRQDHTRRIPDGMAMQIVNIHVTMHLWRPHVMPHAVTC